MRPTIHITAQDILQGIEEKKLLLIVEDALLEFQFLNMICRRRRSKLQRYAGYLDQKVLR